MEPHFIVDNVHLLALAAALWLLIKAIGRLRSNAAKFTPLSGPARSNFVFGVSRIIHDGDDPAARYEEWLTRFGPVFSLPMALGSTRLVLTDPKAIAHFYSRDATGYIKTGLSSRTIENLLGRGLLWAHGGSHKRQRRALSPAFSNAAIRNMTSVFFDSAYQAKAAWDSILEASPTQDAIINVQEWMNHISLDSIGSAGFSHDFGTLKGRQSSVADAFEAFGEANKDLWFILVLMLGPVIPALARLPTRRNQMAWKLRRKMRAIGDDLYQRTRAEDVPEKSIIGLLIKAANADSDLGISEEEVLAQMNVLILAGFETTSISLTWALIELSRNPKAQERLRAEMSTFVGNDPSWEDLTYKLPYLDAVVSEVLRLHPPVLETSRVAAADDILPLSQSVVAASGETVSSIVVRKGAMITVPIHCVNRAEALWGLDAKTFNPERWLDGGVDDGSLTARTIQGHRHLLTFIDGPRTCIGKNFALTEFKAALSVLIRSYAFELPAGPGTKIGQHRAILPRPTMEGEHGVRMPLRVRRMEA